LEIHKKILFVGEDVVVVVVEVVDVGEMKECWGQLLCGKFCSMFIFLCGDS
jgi:hypothetical protein